MLSCRVKSLKKQLPQKYLTRGEGSKEEDRDELPESPSRRTLPSTRVFSISAIPIPTSTWCLPSSSGPWRVPSTAGALPPTWPASTGVPGLLQRGAASPLLPPAAAATAAAV